MIKEKLIWVIVAFSLTACSNEDVNNSKQEQSEPISDTTIKEDVESAELNDIHEPETMDSVQEEAYKNDLSLEIKPIKEEIDNPISEECSQLLEEYASSIRAYDALLKKIEANPDNVSLMIQRTPQEENLDSYATKPQFFSCSQNEAFKKQFDILNEKKDKLLYN